jgi:hypothetical protein
VADHADRTITLIDGLIRDDGPVQTTDTGTRAEDGAA